MKKREEKAVSKQEPGITAPANGNRKGKEEQVEDDNKRRSTRNRK